MFWDPDNTTEEKHMENSENTWRVRSEARQDSDLRTERLLYPKKPKCTWLLA